MTNLTARLAALERRLGPPSPLWTDVHAAQARMLARTHRMLYERLGLPLSAEDAALLADDTPQQQHEDEAILEAWNRAQGVPPPTESARATLLARLEHMIENIRRSKGVIRDATGGY